MQWWLIGIMYTVHMDGHHACQPWNTLVSCPVCTLSAALGQLREAPETPVTLNGWLAGWLDGCVGGWEDVYHNSETSAIIKFSDLYF